MPRKTSRAGRSRLDIRLEAALLEAVQKRVKEQGYRSAGDYVRAVLKRELGRDNAESRGPSIDIEKVMAGNLNQVLGSLRKLHVAHRAQLAFLFAFARSVFKYLPELPADDSKSSDHRAEQRYNYTTKQAEKARFDLLDAFEAEMERLENMRRQKTKV